MALRLLLRLIIRHLASRPVAARPGAPTLGTWAARIRDDLRLGLRIVGVLILGVAAGVLLTTDVALLSLGPQWLGLVLAPVALLAVAATVVDALRCRRRLRDRRLRQRDQAVRQRFDGTKGAPPTAAAR